MRAGERSSGASPAGRALTERERQAYDCVALLQWALPTLGLRWEGFRHVRAQVCKRVRRRMRQLGLPGFADYRARLQADPAEWPELERLCIVTISRFYRDRRVWDALGAEVLPALSEGALASGQGELACWSVGCASGEEPYTLSLLWNLELSGRYPGLAVHILASDVDDIVLSRARAATYAAASLRDLPASLRERGFEPHGEQFVLREPLRSAVHFERADVRRVLPDRTFQLVLCRNDVLTYFGPDLQRQTLTRICSRLDGGGALVIGQREHLPDGLPLTGWRAELGIFRRLGDAGGVRVGAAG